MLEIKRPDFRILSGEDICLLWHFGPLVKIAELSHAPEPIAIKIAFHL